MGKVERIQPYYKTDEVSQNIPLFKGDATLTQDGISVEGKVEIIFVWGSVSIRYFEFTPNTPTTDFEHGEAVLALKLINTKAQVYVETQRAQNSCSGVLLGEVKFSSKEEVSSIKFHIANYLDDNFGHYRVDETTYSKKEITSTKKKSIPTDPKEVANECKNLRSYSRAYERTEFKTKDWIITIDQVDDIQSVRGMIKSSSGFAFTNVGELRAKNGADFNFDEGYAVLKALSTFISFAMGRWVPLQFFVGFDSGEDKVAELWGPEVPDRYRYPQSFFDPNHPEILSSAFERFWDLWNNKNWNLPLVDATHWLIETIVHSIDPDSGIALAQIALEMLSYLILVEEGTVSKKAFKSNSAATNIEEILAKARIPLAVPFFLESLKKVADKESIKGPEVLTLLRNGIIHPETIKRKKLEDWSSNLKLSPVTLKYEACRLYAHYVQLLLLHRMGYNGKYANRTVKRKLGDVENVPWT